MWRKLMEARIWGRIWRERLVEPIHLNAASLFVAIFGDFRAKVAHDLVLRPCHAWGLLTAADMANRVGIKKICAIEFGVANGTGLMNMAKVAQRVTNLTGINFEITGFDTGEGMPAARDWRDHPEHYHRGDYPTSVGRGNLDRMLPKNARVFWGQIAETLPKFMEELSCPIGFISLDVDYYSSTLDALAILDGPVERYMPWVPLYFDDIQYLEHNRFAGQLLAIEDFNSSRAFRKIDQIRSLAETRLFRRPRWIHQMFMAHIFDHPHRQESLSRLGGVILANPYL